MRAPLERLVRSQRLLAGKVRGGETCQIIGHARNGQAQVRFADGATAIVPVRVLRSPRIPVTSTLTQSPNEAANGTTVARSPDETR